MIQKDFPDHHDAELVLKLYELRREAVMREARAAIFRELLPRSADELLAAVQPTSPLAPSFRQVLTYWEMAYGMIRHGVLHADFMLDCNGNEGIFFFARVAPYVAAYREAQKNPYAFQHTEWVATQTEAGQRWFALYRGRVERQLAAAK